MWKRSTLVSVQILLSNFLWMPFLFPEMRFCFFFSSFCDCWRKSQTCVEGKFPGGSNPLLYIPIHRAASSNIVLFSKLARGRNISGRVSNESRGCFFFFLFVLLFINPKDAQINISHKHCTFIGQNKPSELHVSTFQVKEKNNTDFFFVFFGCLAISQIYSKCITYFLNRKKNCHNSIIISATVTQKGRSSMFSFLFSWSSAVNRTSCDSVLILSCICGVTFC